MQITMYNQNGEKAGMLELNSALFEVPWKPGLVHQAMLRQQSGGRYAIAKTKTRGERRGGGKKPWKQKHTGRARVGSSRSPIWRKGGVIFGPRGVEQYARLMPHKQRVLALLSTLSQKARDNQIVGLEAFVLDKPKTKTFATMLKKLPGQRSSLIVTAGENDVLYRSVRNVPRVKVLQASYLNIADLLKYNQIVLLKDATQKMEEVWGAMAKELAGSRSRKEAAKKPVRVKKTAAATASTK